ncbi:MAG: 6-bladed beta-propeller [Prevotella sp.]|jgi:hypothetical protein|nr:6-bladed beta-propeller [Prevotella sp.]
MEQKKRTLAIGLSLTFVIVFAGYSQNNPLDKCKQVAKKNNGVVVCDRTLLKDAVTIPLSALAGELQILKLDGSDAALVKEGYTVISDNYILIKGAQQIPYKLFDKKTGKFLTNIGAFGQGPNEYQMIYDQQLDEANDRIYLLPWQTKKILVYDLKGNPKDPIPLCYDSPKGTFQVDTKASTLIVSILPFKGAQAVAWSQTTDGKLLKAVEPGHLAVRPDFSNEVMAYKGGGEYHFTIFTFEPRSDSLYRYDAVQNKLIPLFTLDFKTRDQTIHIYSEIPGYFLGEVSEPKKENEHITTTQNNTFYIVDKKTLKGSFFRLENDFLGNMEIGWPAYAFSDDYYVRNIDPGNLQEELEKALASNRISPEQRSKLTKLKDSMTENDNNYILYAKVKR